MKSKLKKRRLKPNSILFTLSLLDKVRLIAEDTSPVTAEQLSLGRKEIVRILYPEVVSILDLTPEIQKLVVAGAIASWAEISTTTPSTLKRSTAREYSKLLKKTKERLLRTSRTKSL